MSTGLQVFNESGIEIINSNDPMPFVIASGFQPERSGGSSDIDYQQLITYNGWPEAPVVWIRPRAGYYYNFRSERIGQSQLAFWCGNPANIIGRVPPYDWAVTASAKASGYVPPAQGTGIEVFDANGNLVFSSGQRFPRVTHIQSIKGPYSNSSGGIVNTSAGIIYPFTSMPWLQLSDVSTTRPFPANGDGATAEAFGVSVSADFRTLSAIITDSVASQYNQYQNSNMYIPMAIIPGL